ncbi:MAG: tautomerase family protein [Clostridia bacterium]|nr:tautomerase family protein [Clostridia bacterium]
MPIVRIELWRGRTLDQKKELAKAITEDMVRILKVRMESIQVIFEEVEKDNWAIAGTISDQPRNP